MKAQVVAVEVVGRGALQEPEKPLYRKWTSENQEVAMAVVGTRPWHLAMSKVMMTMWSSSLIGGKGGEQRALDLAQFSQRGLDLVRRGSVFWERCEECFYTPHPRWA